MERTNALRLVDVWLWECHPQPKQKCYLLRSRLEKNGVRRIYDDPYPFLTAAKT